MSESIAVPPAEVVVPADNLQATIDWFVDECGFRLAMITPADDPSIAVLDGPGLRLRLDRAAPDAPTQLRIPVADVPVPPTATGPNGTVVQWVPAERSMHLPSNAPEFVLSRVDDADWGTGRAAMAYRDLIPNRQGGRFIASHISIPTGGPVPDYVHHHHIRFQMIFCHTGWADLVYEDQGPAFRFEAGDCVLQPPHIRHQVLETSDLFEVVEIGCPAVHDTLRDHDLALPTDTIDPTRDFGGQQFVHHRSARATWEPWRFEGFTISDFGIDQATSGLATVGTVRAEVGASLQDYVHDDEFVFWFVRAGSADLVRNGDVHHIGARDSVVLAPGDNHGLSGVSDDFEFLEVRLP